MLTTIGNGLIILVGWPIWFYSVQVVWTHADSDGCFDGYNLFDLINFIALLVISVWPTVLFTILLVTICCWLPGVLGELRRLREVAN